MVSQVSLKYIIAKLASVENNKNNLLFYLNANTLFHICCSFFERLRYFLVLHSLSKYHVVLLI